MRQATHFMLVQTGNTAPTTTRRASMATRQSSRFTSIG